MYACVAEGGTAVVFVTEEEEEEEVVVFLFLLFVSPCSDDERADVRQHGSIKRGLGHLVRLRVHPDGLQGLTLGLGEPVEASMKETSKQQELKKPPAKKEKRKEKNTRTWTQTRARPCSPP